MRDCLRWKWLAKTSAIIFLIPASATARIEIFLMGQTRGLKPPPFEDEISFRGTPFGHMALYVESAARDGKKIVRQGEEGERGGLVLTVDRELKDSFFIATSREDFLYGSLDPKRLPESVTREDLASELLRFDEKYGHLYNRGPGISGLGQDYGILYIRNAWGLVYPTTRGEEAAIIEYWRQHCRDGFERLSNNCVTTILRSLRHAGLESRTFFARGLAPYNAWTYLIKKLMWAGDDAIAPDGDYLRRDCTYLTYYPQLASDAVCRSGRPFNVYSLQNLEYIIWKGPQASFPLPSNSPVSYRKYPSGRERSNDHRECRFSRRNRVASASYWIVSQPVEFCRLWLQSFKGLWYLCSG